MLADPFLAYAAALAATRLTVFGPFLLVALVVLTGLFVLIPYWLSFWQRDNFTESSGFYIGIYSVLGVSQTIFTWVLAAIAGQSSRYLIRFDVLRLRPVFMGTAAGRTLHNNALKRVLGAPMSFFDTTPLGRVLSRLGKDVDVIDNAILDHFRATFSTLSQGEYKHRMAVCTH